MVNDVTKLFGELYRELGKLEYTSKEETLLERKIRQEKVLDTELVEELFICLSYLKKYVGRILKALKTGKKLPKDPKVTFIAQQVKHLWPKFYKYLKRLEYNEEYLEQVLKNWRSHMK